MPRGRKKIESYATVINENPYEVKTEGGPEIVPAIEEKPKNKDFDTFMATIKELSEGLKAIKADLASLNKRVDEVQTKSSEPPTLEQKGTSTPAGNSAIIQVVKDILGDGFEVQVNPSPDGVYFQLVIIPPAQLKEHKDDHRVRMIPHLEGLTGSKEYALRVKTYCVAWASRNGRVYQWPS